MSKMDIDGSLPGGLEANPRTCRCIPVSEVDNAILSRGLALWREAKGAGRHPPRRAVTPRLLKPILRNTSLLKVIEGGADYEYRIVGDACVMAHGQSFQGKRWSETGEMAPGFHRVIKPFYDRVVRDKEPVAMRGWVERHGAATGAVYCEYVFLPLGEEGVDHLLNVAVYLHRDGAERASKVSNSFTV